jgi:hypothetical protein
MTSTRQAANVIPRRQWVSRCGDTRTDNAFQPNCVTSNPGIVPRPNIASIVAPPEALPARAATQIMIYKGPQGMRGVKDPRARPRKSFLIRKACRVRYRLSLPTRGNFIRYRSIPRAITKKNAAIHQVKSWVGASVSDETKREPIPPAIPPRAVYESSFPKWYPPKVASFDVGLPPRRAQAKGPHIPMQCKLVTNPATSAASGLIKASGFSAIAF